MTHELKKRKKYSSGSHQFTFGDARVYPFIHRLKPRTKVQSVNFTVALRFPLKSHFFTGKVIVTASKRYFGIVVTQLDGVVFPTLFRERLSNKTVRDNADRYYGEWGFMAFD